MEMLRSNNNEDTLFDGEVTVRVVEAGVALSSASVRTLKLLVQLRARSPTSKELLVRLTDEQDPFTLYTCLVCEDEYHSLRQHQGLLIDFTAFPHKFVELVNTCIRENQTDSPRFVLVLKCSGDNSSSSLEVVEVNIFKHLCHLALTLAPASTQLKLSYLAECCKILKATITSKEREGAENEQQLKQQIRHMQDIIAKTSSEAQQLRARLEQQSAQASEKQALLVHQEKDKLLKLQSDADRKADRDRRDLEARMNHRIEQLQAKVSSLSTQNAEISERKYRAESNVKELKNRLSTVEGELDRCRQELTHTKKHNAHLDQDYQSKTKAFRELEVRITQLEAEVTSKDTSLTHSQQMVESLQHQKIKLEETVEEQRLKLAKRENSIQLLYADFQKSLDIIKKLQKKVKEEHMSSKVRGAALVEQDKVVGEKECKVAELSDHLQEVTTRVSQLTLENDKLQSELRESLEKILEQDKTLKTNENVIAWLNKQLNEAEMAGAIIKRAPLTEAYLISQPHGAISHSTPLSNTLRSFPTVTSAWSAGTHTTVSSVRHLSNIPSIPEEISPRGAGDSPHNNISPTDKENVGGLDPKYFEPSNAAAIPVHGLLRANYQISSQPKLDFKKDERPGEKNENQKGKGKPAGRGSTKGSASTKNLGIMSKKPSSYFPRS